jgi:hypothetical protein
MNNITINTSMASTVDNITIRGAASVTQTTTSSNAIASSTNVTSSAWTQLSLGSLANVAAIWIQNDNTVYTASVIAVGTGSAGQNTVSILPPGYSSVLSWSGSLGGLYAKVLSGDKDGVIQLIAQQS